MNESGPGIRTKIVYGDAGINVVCLAYGVAKLKWGKAKNE
jgi:hypothetical protein